MLLYGRFFDHSDGRHLFIAPIGNRNTPRDMIVCINCLAMHLTMKAVKIPTGKLIIGHQEERTCEKKTPQQTKRHHKNSFQQLSSIKFFNRTDQSIPERFIDG